MENPELPALLAKLDEDVQRSLQGVEEAIAGINDQLSLLRSSAFPPPQPRVTPAVVNPTWPWTGATTAQGFLSGRWLRRDGTVYSGGAARGVSGPNSPVEGGESVDATVAVSSGVPRVGQTVNPSGNIRPSLGG